MNWYRRAQDEENWHPPDWEKKDWEQLDPAEQRAHRYFSIGQRDDEDNQNYCWTWLNDQLEVQKGKTHGSNFGHYYTDRTFKGWYDVEQDLLSFVFPMQGEGSLLTHGLQHIPSLILEALRQRFGQTFRIVVF
jgi:hypothetical protein